MAKQSRIFLESEGNAWYERNAVKLPPKNDPVTDAIDQQKIKPRSVYEVGCADGWRLRRMVEKYHCRIGGIDPSSHAIAKTGYYANCIVGDASDLVNATTDKYSMVVYGWCLYLCDPNDYLKIAAEGNRILRDHGHIVIYDFYSEFPRSNAYAHKEGIRSYKMDFAKLWLGHPAYSVVSRNIYGHGDDTTAVIILHKHMAGAFPERE